jgi:hypothetical protein
VGDPAPRPKRDGVETTLLGSFSPLSLSMAASEDEPGIEGEQVLGFGAEFAADAG